MSMAKNKAYINLFVYEPTGTMPLSDYQKKTIHTILSHAMRNLSRVSVSDTAAAGFRSVVCPSVVAPSMDG
jgi:hypothetical protein